MTRLIPTILLALTLSAALSGCAVGSALGFNPADSFQDNRSPAQIQQDAWFDHTRRYSPLSDEEQQEADEAELMRQHRLQAALFAREIALGMPMRDVRNVWGEPRSVEVAGYRGYGNERWIYYEGLPTSAGITPTRVIYFENGRVAGWESALR